MRCPATTSSRRRRRARISRATTACGTRCARAATRWPRCIAIRAAADLGPRRNTAMRRRCSGWLTTTSRRARGNVTRVGRAGGAYKDWYGVVYPAKKARGFSDLAFLAEYFDALEINVSFYRPLTAKTAESWLE